ncbi:hypothetical protein R1sor_013534 [Riccia sorocarpa]|uniref:Large ribosomal subunit protein bL9c n=1 Tax=Riccia sorocarpa TaxID=122646 RepID=A0ABD3H6U3_9MARC
MGRGEVVFRLWMSVQRCSLLENPVSWARSRGLKTQKVVLTEKIERLGRAGQVVNVAPGYARNKLIPHHLALPGLDKYVSLVNAQLKAARPHLLEETEEAQSETSEDKQLKEIDAVLKRLDAGKVVFRRDLTGSQALYSPVTKDDLIFEVRRQMGIELAAANIVLPEDLSKLGEFDVELRFPPGLTMPGGREKLFLKIRVGQFLLCIPLSTFSKLVVLRKPTVMFPAIIISCIFE